MHNIGSLRKTVRVTMIPCVGITFGTLMPMWEAFIWTFMVCALCFPLGGKTPKR